MKKSGIIFFVILNIFGCSSDTAGTLMQADREFSSASAEIGMRQAFINYADENAVMLQENAMPIIGKKAISAMLETFRDEGFVLTWEPLSAEISSSGDLGYTYGLYTMLVKADSSVAKGKYVSVWKKQKDGSWKWVLDAGNQGI